MTIQTFMTAYLAFAAIVGITTTGFVLWGLWYTIGTMAALRRMAEDIRHLREEWDIRKELSKPLPPPTHARKTDDTRYMPRS